MSRPKKTHINELMGKAGSSGSLGLKDLEDLLGERMPQISYTPVGRLRLVTALRNRFGDNYRQLKGIDGLLKEFDEEARFAVKCAEMKQIKGRKK